MDTFLSSFGQKTHTKRLILGLVPFVHMCYAAYKVYQGVDYRYPFIADQIDSAHRFG